MYPHTLDRVVLLKQIWSLLEFPSIYRLFWNLVGGPHRNAVLIDEYVRPKAGDRVLDIGCGPATIIPYMPPVEYTGFDVSQKYIHAARASFGDRGTFTCGGVSTYHLAQYAYFDVALAIGVLHHLDDEETLRLFHLARAALKPGGRLITLDGCLMKDQSWAARYFVSRDRGQYVRTREGYMQMASAVFSNVTVSIRHDLLRIPYTLVILECIR